MRPRRIVARAPFYHYKTDTGRNIMSSDGSEGKQRITFPHRASIAHEHDAPTALGFDDMRASAAECVHQTQDGIFAHAMTEFHAGNKKAVVRRGVMDLQVAFVGIDRRAGFLSGEFRRGARDTVGPFQQMLKTAVQSVQVLRFHSAGAATFDVDCRNSALVSGAQRTTGQERSLPVPETIEAAGHLALGTTDSVVTDEVADPGQQFARGSTAVKIDVMRRLSEQLRVEQMRELRRRRAARVTRKGARKVAVIGRVTAAAGKECGFIQNWNHHHGAAQFARSPVFGPRSQQRRTFVFVPMSGAVKQQHRAGSSAPDPSVEADVARLEAPAMEAGR